MKKIGVFNVLAVLGVVLGLYITITLLFATPVMPDSFPAYLKPAGNYSFTGRDTTKVYSASDPKTGKLYAHIVFDEKTGADSGNVQLTGYSITGENSDKAAVQLPGDTLPAGTPVTADVYLDFSKDMLKQTFSYSLTVTVQYPDAADPSRMIEKQVKQDWQWVILGADAVKYTDKYMAWNNGTAPGPAFWVAACAEGLLVVSYFIFSRIKRQKGKSTKF